MAQRQQRMPSDEWELVAANEVHIIEALKQEGNTLFQQQRFFDAIQVYARALALLPPINTDRLTALDIESLDKLEVAVRLNRALAYIELHDVSLLEYAEQDCSFVLARQPLCVKGYYRRALARERLGRIKDALSDVEQMIALEPANPAALQLMARLEEACCKGLEQPRSVESELATAMLQCSLSTALSPQKTTENPPCELTASDTWKALQEEEERLRTLVSQRTSTTRKCGKSRGTESCRKKSRGQSMQIGSDGRPGGAGFSTLASTDSQWAALLQEETSATQRVYKRNAGATTNAPKGKLKTISAASIHPNR